MIFMRQTFLPGGRPALVVVCERFAWYTVRLIMCTQRGACVAETVSRCAREASAMAVAAEWDEASLDSVQF